MRDRAGVVVEHLSWEGSGLHGGERRVVAMKHSARRAAIFLAMVALGHFLRLVFQVEIVAGGVRFPLWASVLACVFTGGLAIFLWRESKR